MRFTRSIVLAAALSVLAFLAPHPSRAALLDGDILDQIHAALNGMAKTVSVIYDKDGNPGKIVNGMFVVTEGAPDAFQQSNLVVMNAQAIGAGVDAAAPIAYPASTQGLKQVNVKVTVSAGSPPWTLYATESNDGINYSPVMNTALPVVGTHYSDKDTLFIAKGHGSTPATGLNFPLSFRNGMPTTPPWVILRLAHDSTATTITSATLTIQGRQF